MSGQWIAVDAYFPGSTLYGRLSTELGPAGPLAWINLICWAKRDSRDGTVKYISPFEAIEKLGLFGLDLGEPPEDWLERFWKLLGSMKQASQEHRRSDTGATQKRRITKWEAWQEDRRRETEAERKRRQRAEKARDMPGTPLGQGATNVPPDSDSDSDSDNPPPPSSKTVAGQPLSRGPEKRRGRRESNGSNGRPPDPVAAAVAVLATARLTEAQAAADAGRRDPIHHPTGWLAAAANDLAAEAGDELAALVAGNPELDPAAIADLWADHHRPPDLPAVVSPPLVVRCDQCGYLTFDCLCEPAA